MGKIVIPSPGPEAWKALLASGEHWRQGFSARTLAHCWEAAQGLPPEVASLFLESPEFDGAEAELLLAIPEHKVPLPGGATASRADVLALARCGGKTIALAVEGKVDEPFGPSVARWLEGASEGKRRRLAFLRKLLGLPADMPGEMPYQLVHRTACAVIEAERFKTDAAAMIVHSFSAKGAGFEAYDRFVALLDPDERTGELAARTLPCGRRLYLGWACGDPRFLAA